MFESVRIDRSIHVASGCAWCDFECEGCKGGCKSNCAVACSHNCSHTCQGYCTGSCSMACAATCALGVGIESIEL